MNIHLANYNRTVAKIMNEYHEETADAREIFNSETFHQTLKRDAALDQALNDYYDAISLQRRKDAHLRREMIGDFIITLAVGCMALAIFYTARAIG